MEYLLSYLQSNFFQTVLVSLVTAYLTIKINQSFESRRNKKAKRFELYMSLMGLNQNYEILSWYELRSHNLPTELENKVNLDRYQVSDLAREIDSSDLKETLETLFLERYTFKEKHKKLSDILDKFGYEHAPKFKKIMHSIKKQNEQYWLEKLEKLKI